MFKPWIKKDNHALPDFYNITIEFLDGTSEEYKIASHKMLDKGCELVLFEDTFTFIPWGAIKTMNFDKNFSKIVHLREEVQTS